MPLKALVEIRRVLKPGGNLATRSGIQPHFFPRSLDLDRLWGQNQARVLNHGKLIEEPTGTIMPALLRKAGFDVGGGKVHLEASASVSSGSETRKWLAWRAAGQLKQGDPFYQSWLNAGITEEEIQETLTAIKKWAETEDAWMVQLHSDILAWK